MICIHWYELFIYALIASLVTGIGASITTELYHRKKKERNEIH